MKRLFMSLSVSFVLLFLFAMLHFEGECRSISDDVFRVHILANSDLDADQRLKLLVRDKLLEVSEDLFSDVQSKDDAKKVVSENLEYFAEEAYKLVKEQGYDYKISAQVARVCFDTRYYDDFTMPGGYYDALQVRIGEAEGKNWWCVMYPSLCISTSTDNGNLEDRLTKNQYAIVSSDDKYVFRLKVVEIFNSIVDYFSR